MLLYAVVAAVAAVVAALCVATGGAALLVVGAVAGAAGAVRGSMICGQLVAPTRLWLTYKSDFKIQGVETITGGSSITCTAFTFLGMSPETITFNPQIKNWSDAIKMGAASFAANVLQGALTGMMIGAAAVALPAIVEGGAVAFAEGGAMNVLRFLGNNLVKNYLASWLTAEGLLLRETMVIQSELDGYGQRGYVTDGDRWRGATGMEQGTAESLKNIAHGSMNPLDYIGVALWFTPVGKMMKGTEESRGGERETAKNENVETTKGGEKENSKANQYSGAAYEVGSNPMPTARMQAWIKYLESKGVEFDIGTDTGELKLRDNELKGLYTRRTNSDGSITRKITLKKNPDVSTFYEECYHALQDLNNHPESGTVYDNEGTIYDEVDLWEYDAKKRILNEQKQLGISAEEVKKLQIQIQQVLHHQY